MFWIFRKLWHFLILLLLFGFVFSVLTSPGGINGALAKVGIQKSVTKSSKPSVPRIPATVMHVYPGGIINVLYGNNTSANLHLLGVDIPGTSDCYGQSSADFITNRVMLQDVNVTQDSTQSSRDAKGNSLAYFYYGGAGHAQYNFNAELLRRGYAKLDGNSTHLRLYHYFKMEEVWARRHDLGLWNACGSGPQLPQIQSYSPAGPTLAQLRQLLHGS